MRQQFESVNRAKVRTSTHTTRVATLAAICICLFFSVSHCAAEEPIDFRRDVQPILSDKCFHCHGPDSSNQESEFRLDTKENLFADLGGYFGVVPGNLEDSELHLRIHSDDESDQMPPPESNRFLTEKEKQILDRWIREGANYQRHYAFEIPKRPEVPIAAVENSKWPDEVKKAWKQNPVDAFIAEKLIQKGWQPSPESDRETLLRRASLTLTGLLPDADLRILADQQEYDTSVDALLKSMAYAERQTLRWLDAARYADTDGYQNDHERTNWPWRDWVIKAYHENMPFDQFTIEQLAGDMLPGATESQRLATAFNRNHRQNGEGGALAAEFSVENAIDRVETTSTVWLGLTMGCARCHDHKYDPLSQKEFYQFYGYFNNIGEKGIGRGTDANPTAVYFSPLKEVDADLVAARNNVRKNVNSIKALIGKRVDTEIETLRKSESGADEKIAADKLPKNIAQRLKKAISNAGDKHSRNLVVNHYTSLDDEMKAAKKVLAEAQSRLEQASGPDAVVMVMKEREDMAKFFLLDRGQYDKPTGPALDRGLPSAIFEQNQKTDDEDSHPKDRLEMARWLVSNNNPLTARVIVNRIWQDHFGVGLVKTSEDFGLQSERPSHPKLLDWLAVEFMESGWDVRAMHRLIVTSAAYKQSSKRVAGHDEIDPENRLLSRGPRFRAEGFVIRDIALQSAGLLSNTVGGPSVKPYQPGGLWESVAANKGTRYNVGKGESLYRKSMYTYWKRAVNPPRQTIFDAGSREVCSVQVRRTNTPLQALVLMNDPTFVECARKLAERTLLDSKEPMTAIKRMYETAVGRIADEETRNVLIGNYRHFLAHFSESPEEAKSLLAVGASKTNDSLNLAELAAMTTTAHLILNLDEFLTIE